MFLTMQFFPQHKDISVCCLTLLEQNNRIEGANASTPPNVPVAHTHPHEHGGMKGETMLPMILPSLLSPNQFLIPARGCNDNGSPWGCDNKTFAQRPFYNSFHNNSLPSRLSTMMIVRRWIISSLRRMRISQTFLGSKLNRRKTWPHSTIIWEIVLTHYRRKRTVASPLSTHVLRTWRCMVSTPITPSLCLRQKSRRETRKLAEFVNTLLMSIKEMLNQCCKAKAFQNDRRSFQWNSPEGF